MHGKSHGKSGSGEFDSRFALLSLALVVLATLVLTAGPAKAQFDGQKQVDKLISKANDTIGAMRAGRLQIGSTVDGYNTIMAGEAVDNRKAYKKLTKELAKSEQSAAKVRTKAEAMDVVANDFFSNWEASLAEFSSEDLRQRSTQRLNDTRKRYEGILEAAGKAGDAFDPFVSNLKDQILFLGHDLNPSAIQALQGDAKKLNGQAAEVFKDVDKTIATASEYTASLRPE